MSNIYSDLVTELNKECGINNDDYGLLIKCDKIANGYGFKIGGNYTPVTVESNQSVKRLFVKTKLFNSISNDFDVSKVHVLKSKKEYTAVDFELDEDISEFIKRYLDIAIAKYNPPKTFSCCSRYLECSNAKKCLHPNQLHAKECYYKYNLENGRIFYGKNKTIKD